MLLSGILGKNKFGSVFMKTSLTTEKSFYQGLLFSRILELHNKLVRYESSIPSYSTSDGYNDYGIVGKINI